ncbi:MAG: flagellar export protein FliJ [Parvibaculaceae bacterium]|jgi:flagellar export protein FliJ|nr:flagellar export protein FliJ [Parvibaculaceae bacterium]|tara:strand:+ start:394 stop:828 length:435 start_codon:yes stop_codon:yes gene_type:complete
MKSRESLIRLNRFQVDERRRQVAELETMLEEFRRREHDLDQQVQAEQEKAGISDIAHYAYPMFAKSMRDRRENILQSINDVSMQLESAKDDLASAYRELKKYELIEESRKRRVRGKLARVEQQELDEVALALHRRTSHEAEFNT